MWPLMLAALGVVYGDIGTSPLYAMKECFSLSSPHRVDTTPQNVLGVLSLMFWALMLVLHLGAIRAAWSGLAGDPATADWAMGGLRLVILLASATLFALKMADVAWLRLRPGWRPLIASVVVVALLHVNVLHRAVERDATYAPAPVAAITLIGAFVESSTMRRGVFRLARAAIGELRSQRRAQGGRQAAGAGNRPPLA